MSRRPFVIISEDVRARAMEFLRTLPIGYRVLFQEQKRSTEQSDRMWAMLGDIVKAGCTINGATFNDEQWKCIFMKELGHDTQVLPTLDGKSWFPTGFFSKDLGKREMADLITSIQAYGDERGVVFHNERIAA
jgi:hypothetical protein